MDTSADFDRNTMHASAGNGAPGRQGDLAGGLRPVRWATMLALVVVAAVSAGGGDAHLVSVIVMVTSLAYLASSALAFRGSAWVVAVSAAAAVAIAMYTPVDAVALLLIAAAAFVGLGLLRGARVDRRVLAIQAALFAAFSGVALTAMMLDPVAGLFLAALTSIAHAVRDLRHERSGEVVGRTFAEFSAVLCAGAGFALIAGWVLA